MRLYNIEHQQAMVHDHLPPIQLNRNNFHFRARKKEIFVVYQTTLQASAVLRGVQHSGVQAIRRLRFVSKSQDAEIDPSYDQQTVENIFDKY